MYIRAPLAERKLMVYDAKMREWYTRCAKDDERSKGLTSFEIMSAGPSCCRSFTAWSKGGSYIPPVYSLSPTCRMRLRQRSQRIYATKAFSTTSIRLFDLDLQFVIDVYAV